MKKIKPKDRKTDLQIAFGKILREKRLEQGLSQEALADLSGLHFTYVSSVERGERNISLENISKLANALKINPRDFFLEI
ncbi:MAG: helix-turn-helix transcriptional regulator [Chlamydiia bacterium]|nr:helix-turn-helix transcriptional regulator [Chlamydiia bacterium]